MMTSTQRRLLARELKRLATALEHGRWSDEELAPHVKRAWRGMKDLHADVCAKHDITEISGHPQTPLEYTLDKITQAVARSRIYGDTVMQPRGFGALFEDRWQRHIGRGCLD